MNNLMKKGPVKAPPFLGCVKSLFRVRSVFVRTQKYSKERLKIKLRKKKKLIPS